MRRLIPILALLCLALSARASISVVNAKQTCTASPCTVTSTTAGHFFVIGTDSSALPTAANVKLGSQAATKVGCELKSTSVSNICTWIITSVTGSQTSVTCTSCGTINALIGIELSGIDATNYLDSFDPCFSAISEVCQGNNVGATIGSQFVPGFSNDFIYYQGNCSASATTVTGTGITLTTGLPNGEPNGQGVVTTNSQITIKSNCSGTGGAFILALKGSGATQTSTANLAYQDHSPEATTGSATITGYAANAGDFFMIHAWCLSTCGTGTLSYGSQSATCATGGGTNANAGENFVCWVNGVTAAGSATVTFTPTGSPTNFQVDYQDWVLSGQTAIAHDTDATPANCASACSEGTTVTTPSITPTTGSLLINAVSTQHHVTGVSGSWGCFAFMNTGTETNSCQLLTTVNQVAWIQNASSGATAAATTILDTNDPFQSVISSFKFSSTAPSGVVRHRAWVIQ